MKLSPKFFKSNAVIFSAGILLTLAACGEDSGTSALDTKKVSTVKDLGTCDSENKDESVYVTKADADYICNGKTWEISKDLDTKSSSSKKTSSSASSKSSASKSKSSTSSKSSASKTKSSTSSKSSASTAKSSTSSKSSASTAKSSTSSKSSSSTAKSSTSSKSSSSIAVSSSSKETGDIAEIAASLGDVQNCTTENKGILVYIQEDDQVFKCDGKNYVDVDYDFKATSSSSVKPIAEESSSSIASSDSQEETPRCTNSFIDERDGREYCTTEIGGYLWMAENLRYKDIDFEISNSTYCYGNKSVNCQKYGRLYTWEAAKAACPEGMSLPTIEEWQLLDEFISATDSIDRYGEPFIGQGHFADYHFEIDTYGDYSAGEFGEGPGYNESYYGIFGSAPFWSATEIDGKEASHWYWYFVESNIEKHEVYPKPKTYAFSVRCLKLAQEKCTSKNEGTVKYNGKDYITCNKNQWHKSTEKEQIAFDIGSSCTTEGKIMQGKSKGDYYICQNKSWQRSSVAAFETQGVNCENGKVVTGITRKDQYFVCDNKVWRDANDIERNTYGHLCMDYPQDKQVIQGDVDKDSYFTCHPYEQNKQSSITRWWRATEEEADIARNTSSLSCKEGTLFTGAVNKDHYYTCQVYNSNFVWKRASDLQVDTFGEKCEVSKIFTGKLNKDKKYACNFGSWKLVSDDDYDLEGKKCVTDSIVAGKVNKDNYYICRENYASQKYWEVADEQTRDINGYTCKEGVIYKGKVNKDKLYSCSKQDELYAGSWHEATATDIDTEGENCTAGKVIAGAVNKDKNYICKGSDYYGYYWTQASVIDVETQGNECVLGKVVNGFVSKDKYYICTTDVFAKNFWREANEIEVDTYGYDCILGEIFKGKVNKDVDYSCSGNNWHVSEEIDYDTEGIKCLKGDVVNGKINEGRFYTCHGNYWEESSSLERNTYKLLCNGKPQTGLEDSDRYYICRNEIWRTADVIETREALGKPGCTEEEDGTFVEEPGVYGSAYCKDGKLSLYTEVSDYNSFYFTEMLSTKYYTFDLSNASKGARLFISCNKEKGTGILNGEKYTTGTYVEVPSLSEFKPDTDLHQCTIIAEPAPASTGGSI